MSLTGRFQVLTLAAVLGGSPGVCAERGIAARDFFGDFEGASLIKPVQVGLNSFTVEAQDNKTYGRQGALMTWACAGIRLDKVRAKAGDRVRIVVPNGNKRSNLRAVYSYDRKEWRPIPAQRGPFDFDVPLEPGHKAVYFATYFPYTYSQMLEHNRSLARSRYIRLAAAGKSVRGRAIPIATITDPQAPDKQKRRAFLLGGTHGQETASIYGVEGMLDFLVSEDPLAREMRRTVIWKVIPIHNVDAAAEGLDRRNAAGINLYFDWGFHEESAAKLAADARNAADPSISKDDFSQPETRAAFDAITAFRPDVFLDVHSWHAAGDGFWGPDPAAQSPAIEALKKSIANYFKIKHWNHEVFPCASAPTVAKKLGIAATSTEFALSFDSDNEPKTPESMRKQGAAILRGTFEYLKTLRERIP